MSYPYPVMGNGPLKEGDPGFLPIAPMPYQYTVMDVIFTKVEAMPKHNLQGGIICYVHESGHQILVAPWGLEKDADLWVFARGVNGRGNPAWRSIRKVGRADTPEQRAADEAYTEAWMALWE